ncbi:superoxide dismutase, Ni [Desulfosarcina sp.]|nr:superoxide dismutase, Ni [Desulfosarcina sp.]
MKKGNGILLVVFTLLIIPQLVGAHCEIPCGIYDDEARADLIAEHIGTVEKSMNEITRLSAEEKLDNNQIVRWITNKDAHATKIQDIVWQYFMAQRIKPVDESDIESYAKYVNELTLLHQISVQAMKAKQTTDMAPVNEMKALLAAFKKSYFAVSE